MIIRVWGIVNSIEVEFTPIPNRPGYWEGTAPRMPGLQEIEIWAESSTGARGHLQCEVMIEYHAHTEAQLLQDCTEADLVGPEAGSQIAVAAVGSTARHSPGNTSPAGKL